MCVISVVGKETRYERKHVSRNNSSLNSEETGHQKWVPIYALYMKEGLTVLKLSCVPIAHVWSRTREGIGYIDR